MLYPASNVADGVVAAMTVARAGRDAFAMVPARAVVVGDDVRAATVDAAREIVPVCLVRSVVVARDAVRAVTALRETTFCLVARETLPTFCVRVVMFFCDWRVREFSSRTAALATPTPTKIAIM